MDSESIRYICTAAGAIGCAFAIMLGIWLVTREEMKNK